MNSSQPGHIWLIYIVLVVLPIVAIAWVVAMGDGLPAPVGLAYEVKVGPNDQAFIRLPVFLGQLAVVLCMAHGLGFLMRYIGQPRVVGEILAGLALGPSLLGFWWEDAYQALFPPGSLRFHGGLSQIGLILFMFLAGLEIDFKRTPVRMGRVFVVSHAGIALPMLCGVLLAPLLYRDYSTPQTTFTEFSLFLGCAMSVTALPVLARILVERGLFNTMFGANAMACAATSDATAWGMLAAIVALEREAGGAWATLWGTLAGAFVFVGFMFFAVRPALARHWSQACAAGRRFGRSDLIMVLLLIVFSALAMEFLQLHAVFGAFIAGLAMPRDERLCEEIRMRFEDLMVVVLLPLFFATTGLRTNLWLLQTPAEYWLAFWIIVVAVGSKLGGSFIAARAVGIGSREAGSLGALMNARGLVELVLLTIGLQDGLITSTLFTMMVFMALITTMMTTPLLALLGRGIGVIGQEQPVRGGL
jgi:Kef-type K+ transport system membrane component KefB